MYVENFTAKGLSDWQNKSIFANLEGYAGLFIIEIDNTLTDQIVDRIEFEISSTGPDWGYDLDDLFPEEKEYPPDWGIARNRPGQKIQLELIRETKGGKSLRDSNFQANAERYSVHKNILKL